MKKILLAAVVSLAALNSFAQAKDATIEVRGVAKIEREIESFQVDFAISEDYGEIEGRKSFEDLKNAFFAKAKAAGLEESRFKEDKMAFQALHLYREGSLYTLEARSEEELLKAAKLANNGAGVISITATRSKFKPLKDERKYVEAAFRDGKEKAAGIAKAIDKKLGAVLSVIDYTPLDESAEDNFYYKRVVDQHYYLSIKFALE
ncbi:SIMPL domain-containing protein [Chitinophaga sp. YIM B06452]|uniref:SIMPL domain-containing protein n=1 Tax=Chitinophaga sp. YIM B06452 TaxID=3082158 RepID=UPI0031FEA4D0